MKSDYCKLIEILSNQAPTGVKSGDWLPIELKVDLQGRRRILHLENHEIGFSFNSKGRFEGIFNWKQ